MTESIPALLPIIGLLLCAAAMSPERRRVEPEVVRLDPQARQRIFDGWGTSLCWWGSAIGSWPEDTPREQLLDLVFDREKGLGLNIVRYNIGGGENPAHHHMTRWRDMPGSKAGPDEPYQWDADGGQRWVLLESIERGVTIAEAFSNSPPWWMTASGCASGAEHGEDCNLRPEMYNAFADYLVDAVEHYRDQWGVRFDTLSPLNEPDADWWRAGGTQEGCHFAPGEQQVILKKVSERLARRGLATRLCAPEENSIDGTIASWKHYDESMRALVYGVNAHSYAGDDRRTLRDLAQAAGKRLYVSEYGNGAGGEWGSALELARVIALDLNELEAQAWVFWQVIEDADLGNDWGAIRVSFSGRSSYTIRKQYWVYLHFTRHITPRSVILHSPASDVVAARNPAGEVVVVVTNRGASPRPLRLDLSTFAKLASEAQCYVTTETKSYAAGPALHIDAGRLSYEAPSRSVTTIIAGALAR